MKNTLTGIEITAGKPGGGKSYWACAEIIRSAAHSNPDRRRPVYTNLPLKMRVLRKYLGEKYGEGVADLIRKLDPDYLKRFFQRAYEKGNFFDRCDEQAADENRDMPPGEKERRWAAAHDVDIYAGMSAAQRYAETKQAEDLRAAAEAGVPYAQWPHSLEDHLEAFEALTPEEQAGWEVKRSETNWVEFGAAIFLDEAHKWFPQDGKSYAAADKAFVGLLSMHRHGFWRLVFLTQDDMKLAKPIRADCIRFRRAINLLETKLVGPFQLRHVAFLFEGLFTVFLYREWTGEDYDRGIETPGVKPAATVPIWPVAPWNRKVFRFYSSHSHVGSPRRARLQRASAMRKVGLSDRGETKKEQRKRERRESLRRHPWVARIGNLVILMLAFYFGGRVERSMSAIDETGAPVLQRPGKLEAVGPSFVRVEGERIATEGSIGDFTLLDVAPAERAALWLADGVVWLQRVGDPGPAPVGRASEFATALGSAVPRRVGDPLSE